MVRPSSGYGDNDDGFLCKSDGVKTSLVYANAQADFRGRRSMVSGRSISRGYARATVSFETVKCGCDCGYSWRRNAKGDEGQAHTFTHLHLLQGDSWRATYN